MSERRPPSIIEVIGVVLASTMAAGLVAVVVGSAAPAAEGVAPAISAAGLAGQTTFTIVVIGLVLLWVRITRSPGEIWLQKPKGRVSRAILIGIVAGIGLQVAVIALIFTVGRLVPSFDTSQISGTIEKTIGDAPLLPKLALALIAGIMAPVSEELLYRGMLFAAVSRRTGRVVGLILSSALFGLAHLNLYSFILLFAVGIVLTLLVMRTESLVSSIAAHIAFNSTAIAGLLAVTSYF
ncbi:MAG: hypothetical protein DCC49_06170 [Acidobacteria bacterium]|nr:MAG: hypothetical protein DCC49_06170 [Acidobacteriota bacterium]